MSGIYRYGMRLRGFSIGCQPMDGFTEREDDPTGKYHDIISYSRKLTDKEVADYELDYLGTDKLTLETFGPDNRTKLIGCSQYRIAADDTREIQKPTLWHIREVYNNLETGEWAQARGCFSTNLQKVIDAFNSIGREREIIEARERGRADG